MAASGRTPIRNRPFPLESDSPDVAGDMQLLASSVDTAPTVGVGTLANRPSPTAPGNRYLVYGDSTAANNGIEWLDTGAAWVMSAPHVQPVGVITQWAGSGDPVDADGITRWLVCDGRQIVREAYPVYMANVGTIWGDGDNAMTVNLPDLRGRTPVGAGQGTGLTNRQLAASGGEETHLLSALESGTNGNAFTESSGQNGIYISDPYTQGAGAQGTSGTGGPYAGLAPTDGEPSGVEWYAPIPNIPLDARAADDGHNTMQPYAVVNHIIKVQ